MRDGDGALAASAPASDEERLRKRQAALSALSRVAARTLNLEELFRTIHSELARVLDATIFLLALYDEASQTIEVVRQVDSGVELPGGSFPLGEGFTSQVIRTRRPRLVRHWSREEPPVQVQYATDRPGLPESGATVPLLFGEQVVGVLGVQSYRPAAFDEDDLMTLQAVASVAAAAIEHLRHSARLDAQLRRRVSELEAILTSMADALLIVDAAGRVVRLNHAARALLRLKDTSIVLGQPLNSERWGQWPLGARVVAEALGPLLAALQQGQALHDFEVEVRGDGRRILSFSGAPLRDAAGALSGGVIVFRDATGRRDVERLKDEMLSIASHDLKMPVTVIKLQAQLLRRALAGGSAPAELLGRRLGVVEDQANRITKLLDLLLDLSRIEAGRLDLEPAPTDLVALTTGLVEGMREVTDRHCLEVRGPARVEGYWDAQRLEEVLQNLLTNAVKYSPNGGAIEITIEADERTATLRVRDQGVGLAPEEAPHVFERFFRAKGVRRLEGAGLGLHICQGIVAAHGGRIWAESAGPGHGSTFCFTLPRGLSVSGPAGQSGEVDSGASE